ncbi:YlcI/YnfO family protein [Atlantibacter sp.]|uniref:YlcI/YnfO family protein n=1 Tax=Atlantibacter sp. TaxID=1903473 RepID=UPI0028A84118|nr:YlcI/YnfO family protein [Atlantibacter sp.]
MATGTTNNKSRQKTARIPLDVLKEVELVKEEGESDAQFIVTSMRGEIKRRQRSKKQETPEG